MSDCIFCDAKNNTIFKEIILENAHAFVVPDNFPASPAHVLLISKEHFEHWFLTTIEVQQSMLVLQQQAYAWLNNRYRPDAYNLGTNCGAAAGQSVFHVHYHIIPRFIGDYPDPKGGVKRAVYN